MMRPRLDTLRARLASATAVAVLAAALTSCGTGQASADGSFEPKGDPNPFSSASSSAPSAEQSSPGPSKPKFPAIPEDTNVVFQTPLPEGKRKATIVRRWRYSEIASVAGLFTKKKPWKPYTGPKGDRIVRSWLHSLEKENVTVTGTLRFYKTHFTVLKKQSAVIETCVSEADWFSRDVKTGEVNRNPVKPKYFYLIDAVMVHKKGGWVMNARRIDKKPAKKCQR